MENQNDILYSYYTNRKIIGLLGLLLPILVVVNNGKILASISHYYYTSSAVFFIVILSSFGLFLMSYRGYKKDEKKDLLSDNVITFIGGAAALMVVFFPTSGEGSGSAEINIMLTKGSFPLYGHQNNTISLIHLLSAGIFFLCMGWMAICRFTRGKSSQNSKGRLWFYRLSGIIMWGSILFLLLEFLIGFEITRYDVFILETISIFAFGISWLIKGRIIKDIIEVRNRVRVKK